MDSIYLDNNATTPLLPAVWEAMQPFCSDLYGNPASSHRFGRKARQALENARDQIAELLGAAAEEVVFTSGATEANNLAIAGLAGLPPAHLLLSPIEHPCVAEPVHYLSQRGFQSEDLAVDGRGRVVLESFANRLRDDTRLVCVMMANHETGTVQPIKELTSIVPEGVAFHCDAAAAAGKIPVQFRQLGVTSLTLSAHKFHGPKGIGALLVRKNSKLDPLFHGGHQQRSKRPGTEPVPLAIGMAKALSLAMAELDRRTEKVNRLRRRFLQLIGDRASPAVVNGSQENNVPHTLNLSFPGCRSDILLMNLDLAGVACSTGSACSSGSLLPSPVLRAMRVGDELLGSAMRFSFSHLLTETEVDEAARRVSDVVNRLRKAQ